MLRIEGWIRPSLAVALGVLGLAASACRVERDRPTGLASRTPTTTVEVTSPQTDDLVPSDSVVPVEVIATGLLQSIGFVLLTGAQRDTVDQALEGLAEATEAVRREFGARIPALSTGTSLEILGVAENIDGDRSVSEPVLVSVIECDVFVIACQ